ncbi:hypothetical protein TNCV_441901 [Trichonephila clavipes]|nr:hypothetical protein TNCV_441901 [Trichonephila clavipes]
MPGGMFAQAQATALPGLRMPSNSHVTVKRVGLRIRDDPVLHKRDQAKEIFKETIEFEKGHYIVQLPFRKSYNERSDNYPQLNNVSKIYGDDLVMIRNYISNTVKSFTITQNRVL